MFSDKIENCKIFKKNHSKVYDRTGLVISLYFFVLVSSFPKKLFTSNHCLGRSLISNPVQLI